MQRGPETSPKNDLRPFFVCSLKVQVCMVYINATPKKVVSSKLRRLFLDIKRIQFLRASRLSFSGTVNIVNHKLVGRRAK